MGFYRDGGEGIPRQKMMGGLGLPACAYQDDQFTRAANCPEFLCVGTGNRVMHMQL